MNDVPREGVSIHAGFPNPAASSDLLGLNLNQLLIHHPSSTFLFRVRGDNWQEQGIFDGDIAIIDRALTPGANDLVIAWEEQGFVICRPEALTSGQQPWGVIRSIIHEYRKAGQ